MIFGGFQKLTLLDFPDTVSCTVFTKGCNFLCPFCHNSPLVNKLNEAADIDESEILSFLNKRQGILEGVCITGGEPLIHKELKEFIKKVKSQGFKVKLDTNGTKPLFLKELINEGLLDYVAMDIKNSFNKYPETAGIADINMPDIEQSINILMQNKVPYEFRTTVTSEFHALEDIEHIAKQISGAERYFIQNFLDSGNIIKDNLSPVSEDMLKKMGEIGAKYTKFCKTR